MEPIDYTKVPIDCTNQLSQGTNQLLCNPCLIFFGHSKEPIDCTEGLISCHLGFFPEISLLSSYSSTLTHRQTLSNLL